MKRNMEREKIVQRLKAVLPPGRVLLDQPMWAYTTFRIGGKVDVLVPADGEDTVETAVRILGEERFPFFVVGNGSNLLVKDGGIPGCVIRMGKDFSGIRRTGERTLYAQAGASTWDVAQTAAGKDLTGCEFLAGIPATMGGAVCMNAGAYGGELKDIVSRVKVMNQLGEVFFLQGEDMGFSYRRSTVLDQGLIVLGAELVLSVDHQANSRALIQELNRRRAENQPLEYPSAGSIFKRPPGHYAARLIDQAGLKGLRVGDAMVSTKHAGFIVNAGQATAKDVCRLIQKIQNTVFGIYGVRLETEVRMIGEEGQDGNEHHDGSPYPYGV